MLVELNEEKTDMAELTRCEFAINENDCKLEDTILVELNGDETGPLAGCEL